MSTARRRKKAARQQSVAQWRATATVVPPRTAAPHPAHTKSSDAASAAGPLAGPDAVGEPVPPPEGTPPPPDGTATPPQGVRLDTEAPADTLDDPAPEPRAALEDQYDWQDHYWDEREGGHPDDEVAEDDAATRRVRRRRAVAVAVGAPLLFVGAFAASGWIINATQDKPSAAVQTGASLPSAPPAKVPVAPPRSGGSAYVPGATVGPGQTEPGALVRVTPTADGSLEVVERVRFADPVTELSLGPPLTKGVATKSLPRDVEVADLQVLADDAIVDIGVRSLTKARTVELPAEASTVVMRYRLTGATVRSVPSTPGRALSLLPPITSPATLGSTPFVIELSGAQVTNVLCPGLPTAAQLCGRTWTRGWYLAPQQPARTAVIAQLTLPDPVSN